MSRFILQPSHRKCIMKTLILYFIITLCLASVLLLILAAFVQYNKYKNQQQELRLLKQKFHHVVCKFRLSKMLAFIGIQLEDYLTRIPHDAIRKHIINCKNCPNIPTCDRCLRDGEYVTDMNFCPNYQSLMAYSRIMPPVK